MTNNIWKYFKVVFIVLFYFLFNSIFNYILSFFKINITSLSKSNVIILSILSELIFALLLYLIYRKDINNSFKDYKENFKDYFIFGFKWWIIGIFIMIVSNVIISFLYSGNSTNEEMVETIFTVAPIYMFISTVIIGPFTEEMIFRRTIKEIFTNDILYIIVCGLFFGLVHVLVGTNMMELLFIIPYGALGSIFAYMYVKKNNILIPFTFHLIHNFIIVLSYMFNLF